MERLDNSINEYQPYIPPNSDATRRPADRRSPKQRIIAISFLLMGIFLERVAYYSLVSGLVMNLQQPKFLNWTSSASIRAFFIFQGTTYLSSFVFGVASDARLGRAKTITLGFFLYLLGFVFSTIMVHGNTVLCQLSTNGSIDANTSLIITSTQRNQCHSMTLFTLILTGIGAGTVKTSVAVFSAEQIHQTKFISSYFSIYFSLVNIGSIIGALLVLTIAELEKGFFWMYLIATILLFLAALLFLLALPCYIYTEPLNSAFIQCFPIFYSALIAWSKLSSSNQQEPSAANDSLNSPSSTDHSSGNLSRGNAFLDLAKTSCGGRFLDRNVNDIKALFRALLLFLLLLPYWIIYSQERSTFSEQGKQMKCNDKSPILMSLVDPSSVLIMLLLVNTFIYRLSHQFISPSIMTKKLIVGMIFAFLSMMSAAFLEIHRQYSYSTGAMQSDLSIFAQIPQCIFQGFAEALATVTSFEFAYFSAPRSAQSLFMSLHFSSASFGSWLSLALLTVFSQWSDPKTNNFDFTCPSGNCPSYYTYFFVLAFLLVPLTYLFFYLNKKYDLVRIHPQQTLGKV